VPAPAGRLDGLPVEAQPAQAERGHAREVGQRVGGAAEGARVAVARVVARVGEVEVRVELDDLQAVHVVEGAEQRVAHRVVAAEEDRQAGALAEGAGGLGDALAGELGLERRQVDVARVAQRDAGETGAAGAQVVEAFRRQRVAQRRLAHGARGEALPGAEAHGEVEGDAEHGGVGRPVVA
jgi:hypothetical protein